MTWLKNQKMLGKSFKPYYKWITFNTHSNIMSVYTALRVLNLIINGLPSILLGSTRFLEKAKVLNLIINGLPSIPQVLQIWLSSHMSFKPYYKWITFNT